jgi:Protein of unknown function (DUF3263)
LDRSRPGRRGSPDARFVSLNRRANKGLEIHSRVAVAHYPGPMTEHADLTDREIDILDFERSWWKHAGVKEQAIKERFDMSATRYYQVLNELLENPAALAHDPILVKRLKRLRTYRQRQRVARLLGAEYAPGRK